MAQVDPKAFPFCGPSYLDVSPVIDAQRSINLYPEPGLPSSKTAMGLTGRPGLALYFTLPTSPSRSLWAGNGRLFGAGGTHFYELNHNPGAVLTDYGAMAGSGGTGPCPAFSNGTQLLVLDTSVPAVFNANPAGPAMTKVFDAVALEYLDGFYVAIATGASLAGANPNQVNVSNNGDGTTWGALNFGIRTSASDLTIQLATLNGLLWVFGQKTATVYYNAGSAGFPFARVNGGDINLGCISPYSVAKFYNCLMWLGADDRGYAQVYMAQGLNPSRVSTAAIELRIAQIERTVLANVGTSIFDTATAYGYQEAGHTFYVLNFKEFHIGNSVYYTLVYDLTTGLWHERSYGTQVPICFSSLPNWQFTPAYASDFVGDANSGKIFDQGINYASDNATAIAYQRTAPHVSHDNTLHRYNRFELDGDFGTATPTLDYSNDGGRTFLGHTTALRQNADAIAPSTFRRFYTNQLGVSRDRVFRVSITDSTNLIRIANAYLDVD